VGTAVLQRLGRLQTDSPQRARLSLVAVANSRRSVVGAEALSPLDVLTELRRAPSVLEPRSDPIAALGDRGTRIVIDATANDAVAAQHARWLERGIHVATANKLGCGAALARWDEIQAATVRGGARYGDAATVGAGLPLIRSLLALRRGGDRIDAIAGGLSGSLAWLFAHFDGRQPFSALVHEARRCGYTEPDPGLDLCGEDVRRKLLILARSAGARLDDADTQAESLVPRDAALAEHDFRALDAPLLERLQRAEADGRVLRYIARFDAQGARAGLEALAPDDPLAQGAGCDNRVAIWSDRYRERPLLIQGPGAGTQVTAAALLDDVLAIADQLATDRD
jgi:homoserine dehydrogenase